MEVIPQNCQKINSCCWWACVLFSTIMSTFLHISCFSETCLWDFISEKLEHRSVGWMFHDYLYDKLNVNSKYYKSHWLNRFVAGSSQCYYWNTKMYSVPTSFVKINVKIQKYFYIYQVSGYWGSVYSRLVLSCSLYISFCKYFYQYTKNENTSKTFCIKK